MAMKEEREAVVRWQRRRRDGHVERVGGGLGFAA
jgi:hypothetical protein